MRFEIEVKRLHAYVFSSLVVILLSIGLVNAFGGSNPVVLGHSAAELIVNGSSIVDGSVNASDIDQTQVQRRVTWHMWCWF
ncbi:hypothetical protein J4219_04640 [Candidatus Woesearchaeota archaeon]|nr:hypothetical protein [Candidatus Woesearchaeota archaeon]